MIHTVGTRGSALAMAQSRIVVEALRSMNPGAECRVRIISTRGDTDARPLFLMDQKGVFEGEIDAAVLRGEIDFAVHSLKDVPASLPDGLLLCCVPKREDPRDTLVSLHGGAPESLGRGALVGTSSLRRAVMLQRMRRDIRVVPVRGNIDTRISGLAKGRHDALVLAASGIRRLGINVRHFPLSASDFVPSPGQGALGIVCRRDDAGTAEALSTIQDADSRAEVDAERALSEYVESGCRFPVGALARVQKDSMTLNVAAFSLDGKKSIGASVTGSKTDPREIGRKAGMMLREQGINELGRDWRQRVEEWNG